MALLSLETESTRETVIIDGKEYRLTPVDGFSIIDQQKWQYQGTKLKELGQAESISEEEAGEMEELVGSLFKGIAGDIPPEVQDKIKFMSRLKLINAYFLAVGPGLEKLTADLSRNGQAPGSLASEDSTEEAQRNG